MNDFQSLPRLLASANSLGGVPRSNAIQFGTQVTGSVIPQAKLTIPADAAARGVQGAGPRSGGRVNPSGDLRDGVTRPASAAGYLKVQVSYPESGLCVLENRVAAFSKVRCGQDTRLPRAVGHCISEAGEQREGTDLTACRKREKRNLLPASSFCTDPHQMLNGFPAGHLRRHTRAH